MLLSGRCLRLLLLAFLLGFHGIVSSSLIADPAAGSAAKRDRAIKGCPDRLQGLQKAISDFSRQKDRDTWFAALTRLQAEESSLSSTQILEIFRRLLDLSVSEGYEQRIVAFSKEIEPLAEEVRREELKASLPENLRPYAFVLAVIDEDLAVLAGILREIEVREQGAARRLKWIEIQEWMLAQKHARFNVRKTEEHHQWHLYFLPFAVVAFDQEGRAYLSRTLQRDEKNLPILESLQPVSPK